MKVFFDNCTSPVMARTLGGYIDHLGHEACHARDLGLERALDVEWIKTLSEGGGAWLIFTGDSRISKNKAEREAFRRAGLKGVALAPAYQKTPMNRCCAVLVDRWGEIHDFMGRLDPPVLVQLPINFSSKLKVLPL